MKFKIDLNWFDKGLLVVIILELLALLAVKLFSPFNKVDFYYISMPVISALAFIAVGVSIYYVKKSNDERLSQEYYNFYIEKIEKYKQSMIDEKLSSLIPSSGAKGTDNIYDFQHFLLAFGSIIMTDSDYKDDLEKIKFGKKFEHIYFIKRSYFKALMEMGRLVEKVSAYARKNYRLLWKIKSDRKLTDDHVELLSRQILSELLREYLLSCSKLSHGFPEREIVNLFENNIKIKVMNIVFSHTHEVIRKDDTLKNSLSSEGIKLD